jgi:putative methanogenesis marker protein 14
VVRSTGVVAGFASPDDIGEFILALADGCINAGVPPKNMCPAMTKENLPKRIRPYSYLDKVIFDGAVASTLPPIGSTGLEIVANEMEAELATAGIKEASKWAGGVDFRNPCLSIDFGTTLKGRITNDLLPYARTVGSFCGLAGAVSDGIVRGSDLVDPKYGNVLDVTAKVKPSVITEALKDKVIDHYAKWAHEMVQIEVVPMDRKWYGSVPVNPAAAKNNGVMLVGCEVGENGKDLPNLREVGADVYKKHGVKTLLSVLDEVSARIAQRLIQCAIDHQIISEKTAIGVTGRAGITGNKPYIIIDKLNQMGIYKDDAVNHVVFCDDGLARGAAVMARCMNSFGTPKIPLGGVQGGKCIMGPRIRLQNKK